LVIAGLGFLGHLEYLRLVTCLEVCNQQQVHDFELSESTLCRNLELRINYQKAGTLNCDMAEARLKFTPKQCALRNWFAESELVRLWGMMTISYWHLLGLIVPITFVIFKVLIGEIFAERREKRFLQKQDEYLQKMRSFTETQRLQDRPLQLGYSRKAKKRKKVHGGDQPEYLFA